MDLYLMSSYWRLTHPQVQDHFNRKIISKCSLWCRHNFWMNLLTMVMSSFRNHLSKSFSTFGISCDAFGFFFTYWAMSFQFESLNVKKGCFSSTYFCHWKFSCTFWSLWLNDATRIRTVFSSRFSLHVEFHLYRIHYCTHYLWLAFFFWIDHHPLHPVWWRHFTPRIHVSRDLSFLLLYRTICFRSRCYRRFCSSSMILFWHHVGSAGGSFDNMSYTVCLVKLDFQSDTSIELTNNLRDNEG